MFSLPVERLESKSVLRFMTYWARSQTNRPKSSKGLTTQLLLRSMRFKVRRAAVARMDLASRRHRNRVSKACKLRNPDSNIRISWDLGSLIMVLYDMVMIPMQLACCE